MVTWLMVAFLLVATAFLSLLHTSAIIMFQDVQMANTPTREAADVSIYL